MYFNIVCIHIFDFKANLKPNDSIVVVIRTTDSVQFSEIVRNHSKYFSLIQSTVKQPLVVWNPQFFDKSHPSYFSNELDAARSVLTNDILGNVIIKEICSASVIIVCAVVLL